MTITLKRSEVCALLLACTVISTDYRGSEKYQIIHDKLAEQLEVFDMKKEGRI